MIGTRRFGIAVLCASCLCAPANAQEPDRWAFHRVVNGLDISGVKDPKFDAVVVTVKYPGGSRRSLDEVLPCCVDEIRAFQNRLVFVGSEYVTVLERTSAAVVDQFMHSEAVVSPGGRFIALLPITPRWAEATDMWVVYDVARPRSLNRMGTVDSATSLDPGGWVVYPLENARKRTLERRLFNVQFDPVEIPSRAEQDAMHRRRSPIQWVSDDEFAFLDYSNRQLRIVSVDVAAGVEEPRVASAVVDPVPLVDAGSIPAYRRAESPSAALIRALAIRPLKTENGALVVQLELFPEPFVRQKDLTIRIAGAGPRRLTQMSSAVISTTASILREGTLQQKAAAVRSLRRSNAASLKRLQEALVEEFNRAVARDLREVREGRKRTQRAVMTGTGIFDYLETLHRPCSIWRIHGRSRVSFESNLAGERAGRCRADPNRSCHCTGSRAR